MDMERLAAFDLDKLKGLSATKGNAAILNREIKWLESLANESLPLSEKRKTKLFLRELMKEADRIVSEVLNGSGKERKSMVYVKLAVLKSLSIGDAVYVEFDTANRNASTVMKSIAAMAAKLNISVMQKTFIAFQKNNDSAKGCYSEIIRVERTK